MRQHKNLGYFLFTSGCLNLTQAQYDDLQTHTSKVFPDRESSNATQLCEVSTINTCLCTNRDKCNNVSQHDPFAEYVVPIFRNIDFNELAHFKYFLPNDPVLDTISEQPTRDEYFLIKSVSSYTSLATTVLNRSTSALLFIAVFCILAI